VPTPRHRNDRKVSLQVHPASPMEWMMANW